MDVSKKDDLTQKLILVLKKITECKKFDSIYTEKFLVSICDEFSNSYESIIQVPEFSEWLSETFQKWKQFNPAVAEAIFICKFIGILAKNEQGFQALLNSSALSNLTNHLQSDALKQTALTPVYISFLSDILSHTTGYKWVKNNEQWKTVSKLYFSNSNLYVEREGLKFLKKFFSEVIQEDEESKETFQQVLLYLSTYKETDVKDQKLCSVTVLFLNLIQSILEAQIFSRNSHLFSKFVKIFDLLSFLNFLLENSEQEIILEKASTLQIILFVIQYENKKELLHSEDLSPVFETFFIMLRKNQFNGIIKLAKYCQVLWCGMRKEWECESHTVVQFIVMQLWSVLLCIKPGVDSFNIHLQKLFSLTTTDAKNFCYKFKDEISHKVNLKSNNLALKGILSVTSNIECLNSEEAVIIFQTMTYILKSVAFNKSCSLEIVDYNELEKETSLCIQDTTILSAVLNALCVIIEKFKIKWFECLESICLIEIICTLIENPNSFPLTVVHLFSLLKSAILTFLSPGSPMSSKNSRNPSFDRLMSLLYKRLYDPNWEIRDSCLEVVTAIAELKCPIFEDLLVEKKFCSLVFDIMEGDSESYVRASAIQALTAMIKIEALNEFLISSYVSHKIVRLLQNESEAIVRREAALMITQLFLAKDDLHDKVATSFYEVMGYSAICDLHWEVKLNSLVFWEVVIQRIISDNTAVNGYAPKVEFPEENEVKSKLGKALTKLSEIGCLYVLLSTLNDDCDMPVIQKSAEILSQLVRSLEQTGVMELCKDVPVDNRISMKRKNTALDSCEKKKTMSVIPSSCCDNLEEINSERSNNEDNMRSDDVIDEIVHEKDIDLLSVCFQKEQTVNPQKKFLLQEVKPETFLLQMQNFNFEKFLEEKQKWLVNVEVDFKSLLLETCAVNETNETNVMDCY